MSFHPRVGHLTDLRHDSIQFWYVNYCTYGDFVHLFYKNMGDGLLIGQ